MTPAPDPPRRDDFRRRLHDAAHRVGFFQLTGHGVAPAEAVALLGLVRAFFALPEQQRLALSNLNSPHFRGYTRIGGELPGGRSDWRDQLDVGTTRPAPRLRPPDPPL